MKPVIDFTVYNKTDRRFEEVIQNRFIQRQDVFDDKQIHKNSSKSSKSSRKESGEIMMLKSSLNVAEQCA